MKQIILDVSDETYNYLWRLVEEANEEALTTKKGQPLPFKNLAGQFVDELLEDRVHN